MKHTIQALVENKFGVLSRVASLFSARGYNISSLAVSETHDNSISCMTIIVDTQDERILDQIKKQLNRLIDVISVSDLTKKDFAERELVLVKVSSGVKEKVKIKQLVKRCAAAVIEAGPDYMIIEISASQDVVEDFLASLKIFGIKELVRTGRIAMLK